MFSSVCSCPANSLAKICRGGGEVKRVRTDREEGRMGRRKDGRKGREGLQFEGRRKE